MPPESAFPADRPDPLDVRRDRDHAPRRHAFAVVDDVLVAPAVPVHDDDKRRGPSVFGKGRESEERRRAVEARRILDEFGVQGHESPPGKSASRLARRRRRSLRRQARLSRSLIIDAPAGPPYNAPVVSRRKVLAALHRLFVAVALSVACAGCMRTVKAVRPLSPDVYNQGVVVRKPSVTIARPRPQAFYDNKLDERNGFYRVAKTDTLVSIAERFYGDQSYRREIYQENRQEIDKAGGLKHGMVVILPKAPPENANPQVRP